MSNPYLSPDSSKPGETKRRPTSLVGALLKVVVTILIVLVGVALLLPSVRSAKEPARRMSCSNNLKNIALALHTYHDTYHNLPPAYTVDSAGRRLHSWRTLLLPYLEQQALYDRIDLSKPWDDPLNQAVFAEANSKSLRCPNATCPTTHTTYLAVVGPNTCFPAGAARKLRELESLSNTLILVEVSTDRAVPWMSPEDLDEASLLAVFHGEAPHPNVVGAAMADGTVQFLSTETSEAQLKALLSIDSDDNRALDLNN